MTQFEEELVSVSLSVFPTIHAISDSFNGILLDAYGVFWGGNGIGLLPGSKEAMEKLVSSGKIVGILSNSTQLAAKEINKLQLSGLVKDQHFHFLITSGEVAKDIFLNKQLPFKTPNHQFFVFGKGHPKFPSHETLFQDTPYKETLTIKEADFIYIAIPHLNGEDQTNPESFRSEIEKIKECALPMVCANPDCFAHEGNPSRLVVRQGSIAALYAAMGGQVFYIGKPYDKAYKLAMESFQKKNIKDPSQILMVGDTPETDIRGALQFGMSAALVTQTGILAERASSQGLEKAIQALPKTDFPNFFIEKLAHGI